MSRCLELALPINVRTFPLFPFPTGMLRKQPKLIFLTKKCTTITGFRIKWS